MLLKCELWRAHQHKAGYFFSSQRSKVVGGFVTTALCAGLCRSPKTLFFFQICSRALERLNNVKDRGENFDTGEQKGGCFWLSTRVCCEMCARPRHSSTSNMIGAYKTRSFLCATVGPARQGQHQARNKSCNGRATHACAPETHIRTAVAYKTGVASKQKRDFM